MGTRTSNAYYLAALSYSSLLRSFPGDIIGIEAEDLAPKRIHLAVVPQRLALRARYLHET